MPWSAPWPVTRLNPERLFAGTDKGLYASGDAGQSWKLLDSPLSQFNVWALAFDPADPDNDVRRHRNSDARGSVPFQGLR